jgi:hypothetical protein
MDTMFAKELLESMEFGKENNVAEKKNGNWMPGPIFMERSEVLAKKINFDEDDEYEEDENLAKQNDKDSNQNEAEILGELENIMNSFENLERKVKAAGASSIRALPTARVSKLLFDIDAKSKLVRRMISPSVDSLEENLSKDSILGFLYLIFL